MDPRDYDLSEWHKHTFWPDQNLNRNLNIPEVEILSDDESIFGLTDRNQHSTEFIHNELNWRQRIEDYRMYESNENRNADRAAAIDVLLTHIGTLIDVGNYAESTNDTAYDWTQHDRDMAYYENELRQLENVQVQSQRNQRADERQLLRNWLPFNHPNRLSRRQLRDQPRRRRRGRRMQRQYGTGFERF